MSWATEGSGGGWLSPMSTVMVGSLKVVMGYSCWMGEHSASPSSMHWECSGYRSFQAAIMAGPGRVLM